MASPCSRMLASKNASMGLPLPSPGTGCLTGSTKAHHARSSSVIGRSSSLLRASRRSASSSETAPSGIGAPAMIHLRSTSIFLSDSLLLPGGMCGFVWWFTKRHSQLNLRFEPTTAAPRSPPRRIFSRVRKSRPDCWIAAPWHIWQSCFKIALASSAKSFAATAVGTATSSARVRMLMFSTIVVCSR